MRVSKVYNIHTNTIHLMQRKKNVGYRHVYLEGMAEASIFIHVAVNDITGKVS